MLTSMASGEVPSSTSALGDHAGKRLSREQLLTWRQQLRQQGRTLVHCHGCFDIVHPGHIAHLQEARQLGDALLVSVSSDAFVNKGVARPLIPDELRAASLAALACVDAVYINPTATAVELIRDVRPDVFVKGAEYERSADPRFLAERAAVVEHGGRVVFTSGQVVYSSTALIQQLQRTDPFEQEKLARFRDRHGLGTPHLLSLIRRFEGLRVVIVGDYLLDRYHFCDATGIASEAPLMSLRLLGRQDFDGGAAVLARHAAALGCEVCLMTHLGNDPASHAVVERLSAAGIAVRGLRGRRDLVTKHRYLCETTKVMKVDEGSAVPLDSAQTDDLTRQIAETCDGADAVVFCDFGYGMLSPAALDRWIPEVRNRARVIAGDVSGRRATLTRFRDVDLLTPTEKEMRDACGDVTSGLNAVAWQLLHATASRGLIATLGRQGAIAFDRPPGEATDGRLRSEYVPALNPHAVDPLGCGDALLATATLTLAAGGNLQAAALLGSVAAAAEAAALGNVAIAADELIERVALLPETTSTLRLAS